MAEACGIMISGIFLFNNGLKYGNTKYGSHEYTNEFVVAKWPLVL
ncbi:MAG TPA: hypothetical protein PLW44_02235 [Chitinophagales bacterium]|nr:hypothetical protein [Chitinophagales bacterium]